MMHVGLPVVIQHLISIGLNLVDTLMIGALGDTPLAAVGMAGKWSWFLGIVLFGFTSGAAVFIAQYFGAGDTRGIHRTYGLMSMGTMAAALLFMVLQFRILHRWLLMKSTLLVDLTVLSSN